MKDDVETRYIVILLDFDPDVKIQDGYAVSRGSLSRTPRRT